MTSRQAVQGHQQLHPYRLSRGHHKQCSFEPYSAQAGVLTGSLREQQLAGQGTVHHMASRWRIWLVHFPRSSSILSSLFTMPWSLHSVFSSRHRKNCPTAINLTSRLRILSPSMCICTEIKDIGRSSFSYNSLPFLTYRCRYDIRNSQALEASSKCLECIGSLDPHNIMASIQEHTQLQY